MGRVGPVACSCIRGHVRVHSAPKVASDGIARALQGLPGFSRERVDQSGPEYRFGLVRHPLDRLVSGWAYFCRDHRLNNQQQLRDIGYRHDMTFAEFLEVAIRSHWQNQHTRRQVDFIGAQHFDRLARLENLTAEWDALMRRFPVLTKHVNRINTSTRSPKWAQYYTKDMRRRAESAYAADMDLYEKADPRPPKE